MSGPHPGSEGALIESTRGGQEPVTLHNGETRTFLEDGDRVVIRGWCEKDGTARVGFGEGSSTLLPARKHESVSSVPTRYDLPGRVEDE